MNGTVRTIAKKSIPLDFRFILLGAGMGLIMGVAEIGDSIDLAAGAGIAAFVSFSLGGWLSVYLVFPVFDFYGRWVTTLGKRIEAVEAKFPRVENPGIKGKSKKRKRILLFGILFLIFPFAVVWSVTVSFLVLFEMGTDIFVRLDFIPVLAAGTVLALLDLACLSFFFWRLGRKIARVENILNPEAQIPLFFGQAQILDNSVKKTRLFVRKVVGMPERPEQIYAT